MIVDLLDVLDPVAPALPVVAVLAPLVVALVLVVADRFPDPPTEGLSRPIAVGGAVVSAVAAGLAVLQRPEVDLPWIPAIGVRLDLAVDGISAPLVLLTAVAGVVAVVIRYHEPERDHPTEEVTAPLDLGGRHTAQSLATYYGCLLVVMSGAMLAFLARDGIVFFIAFEMVLVPMWLLVARHGDGTRAADRDGAAVRFILFTATGSTLMLVGILALATATGTSDMGAWVGRADALDPRAQVVVAALLVIGLGMKIPVFPLHTWLPWVHSTAPTAGSVLLAAVLLKLGVYGMIRLVVAPLPNGFATISPVVAGFAVTGIVWAGLACLVERDLKRLIAWSSIAHLGFIVLALTAGTATGLQAALFGNVAHGLISALLFVVVGELKHQWGTADLRTARAALREVAPRMGFALVVGMAAAMGLPGLAGFWGEFGALYAAWSPAADRTEGWFRVFALVAALGAVLAAAYAVRVLREVWAGDRTTPLIGDARRVNAVVLGVLIACVVALGVYPVPLLDLTEPAVSELFALVGGAR